MRQKYRAEREDIVAFWRIYRAANRERVNESAKAYRRRKAMARRRTDSVL